MLGRGFKGNTLRTWQMKTGPWSISNLVMNIKKKNPTKPNFKHETETHPVYLHTHSPGRSTWSG